MMNKDEIKQGLMAIAENIELQANAGCFRGDDDLNIGRALLEDLVRLALAFMNPDERDQAWDTLESIIDSSREDISLNT